MWDLTGSGVWSRGLGDVLCKHDEVMEVPADLVELIGHREKDLVELLIALLHLAHLASEGVVD